MASNTTTGTLVKDNSIGPVRRVLTVHEKQALQTQVDVFGYGQVQGESQYPGSAGAAPTVFPGMMIKRNRLNDQQKQVLKVLKDQAPEPTNPDERDRIKRRLETLKEEFLPYLQTRREIRAYSRRDPDFMTALEKAADWNKPQEKLGGRTPEQVSEEYRNLSRRLDPENPNADSLEKFRAK